MVSDASDKYLRLAAEYDNYRKRTTKEKENVYADAKDINERRAAEEDAEVIEDASEEKADEE